MEALAAELKGPTAAWLGPGKEETRLERFSGQAEIALQLWQAAASTRSLAASLKHRSSSGTFCDICTGTATSTR